MASEPQIDDEDDFGSDYPGSSRRSGRSGDKRHFGDLDEEEDDVFDSNKKGKKVEESAGATTGMILSLRESLQKCTDDLAACQAELETAQSEIRKWHSAFQNGPAAPDGTNPEPGIVIVYLQNLKSSEDLLKEMLEKAKKREAAFIVTFAKREQEIADLKSAVRELKKQLRPPSVQTRRLLLDPAIHEEFTRLKNLIEEKDKKVKELRDKHALTIYESNSKMGQMLMAKCKTLQEENEEIGAVTSEGKIHELEMKIAMLKTQNAELRNQFDVLYKHMDGLIDEVDRSNELANLLQDELEAKDYELEKLKAELRRTNDLLAQKAAQEKTATASENEESVLEKETVKEEETDFAEEPVPEKETDFAEEPVPEKGTDFAEESMPEKETVKEEETREMEENIKEMEEEDIDASGIVTVT